MAFYRKPKPETMRKNRESNRSKFETEIKWLKDNVSKLTRNKHKFLIEMYTILISGSRKYYKNSNNKFKEWIIIQ